MNGFRSFLFTITGSGLATYGFLKYKIHSNCELLKEMAQQEGKYKDDTRAANEGFGINWGYKADMMIMETMDTGDIIFTKRNCDYSTSIDQYFTCLKTQILPDSVLKFDNAYIAIRKNEYEVDVLGDWADYKEGKGDHKPGLISYQSFLRSPLYNEVAMRKLIIDTKDEEFKELYAKRAMLLSWEVLQNSEKEDKEDEGVLYDVEIEDFENNDAKSRALLEQNWTPNLTSSQKSAEIDKIVAFLVKSGQVKELAKSDSSKFGKYSNSIDMYFNEMEMLTKGIDSVQLEEIDSNYPNVFRKLYQLDKKVIIRGQNNVNLFRDEYTK